MTIQMPDADRLTLEQMREFLQGSRPMKFLLRGRAALYQFLERVLALQHYARLARPDRGVVRTYLAKLTGFSRAQLTRLIGRWVGEREIRALPIHRRSFPRRYRSIDIAVLARTDAAHSNLSGPALCRILQREYQVYGIVEFDAAKRGTA